MMAKQTHGRIAALVCGLLTASAPAANAGEPTLHGRGLHGYIGFEAQTPPDEAAYGAGVGFYTAAWPLVERPIAGLQIGLASTWIVPDNSDNTTVPLAPVGTHARDHWPERGPTYGSVFQTVEGGLGYWAGNQFPYGPPKFSMNATPSAYDHEVASPGWGFFRSGDPLPDELLAVAQLSNRVLIPPDGLPFAGTPDGEFFGYTWMALPLTEAVPGDPDKGIAPTGEQSWTCFLSTENFNGPIACYLPEAWSKLGQDFDYPFIFGRGLDSRGGDAGGGAIEINTVPRFEADDAEGVTYSKIPELRFPVDADGASLLVQDVTFYADAACADRVRAWRDGGAASDPAFDQAGAWQSDLTTRDPGYDLAGVPIDGVEAFCKTSVLGTGAWGLRWADAEGAGLASFPQYFRHEGDRRVVVRGEDVPPETGLAGARFSDMQTTRPYVAAIRGAWAEPGPVTEVQTVDLVDGSTVGYVWYRFIDQPCFASLGFSEEKKQKLQALVERMHERWTPDLRYMPPPTRGEKVSLDPALLVTPPAGLEIGFVPVVIRQEKTR